MKATLRNAVTPLYPAVSSNAALTILLAVLLFFSMTPAYAEQGPNAIIVPLKINTPSEKTELTEKADLALEKAIQSTDAYRKNFKMTPRHEAEEFFNYQASWPPPFTELQKHASAEAKYVATGSLTRTGSQLSLDVVAYDVLDPSKPEYFFIQVQDIAGLDSSIEEMMKKLLGHTGKEYLIASIEPKGNARIDSGAVLYQIKSRAGGPYDPILLRDDMKTIFAMGYFDDVQIKVDDTAAGKRVIFEVKEKPIIGQITITGAKKLKEEKVREAITLVPNTIINPKKVQEAVNNIETLYKEKGFYDTEITSSLRNPKPERVDIEFAIKEGIKIYIKQIKISGNTSFSDRKIRKNMKTSKKGLFSFFTDSGVLNKDTLEQDISRISYFYHNHGYIDAKVGEPEIVKDGKWLYITLNISEGEHYRVGNISLAGDLIDDEKNLLALLDTPKEEFLNRSMLRDDIFLLTDLYSEQGYAFADITPQVKEDTAEKKVDITLNITKGEIVHINRIKIKGNTRTRDKVIRREIEVQEKGLYNSKALRESNKNLKRLDYFEEIDIRPEPTPEPDIMDVLVEVKEKPTGAFSIGGGYSSTENLMFMGEISQNNFLGKGQRLALQANLSSRTTKYQIGFTEPHLNDSDLLFGFDLYNMEREFDDYTKNSYGGALRFGYPIWELWKMGTSYGYDDADLTDIRPTASNIIRESMNLHVTSYVTLAFSRDTIDMPMDPTEGSLHIIEFKYAGGPLGGDSEFSRVDASSSWFFPLEWAWDTTYHVKWAAGQLFENSPGKLPVFEKYYLGGIRSIRGFRSGRISPTDPLTRERIGGKSMWYMNNEWIFPLAKDAGLKGLLFFDCGNVYSDNLDANYVKKSVGLGFRWASPMGPLRIEWGYVIDPAYDEDASSWDFNIGGAF